MSIEIRRMWPRGPQRQFADVRPNEGWGMPHAPGGYVGQYVCDRCNHAVVGVYSQPGTANSATVWICAGCQQATRPKQPQPAHLRKVLAMVLLALAIWPASGCHRMGVAMGEALRNPHNYPPTLSQSSGYYPDEIACIYEGWPLYFRQRYVAASGGYVCVYAGHGHTGTIACD